MPLGATGSSKKWTRVDNLESSPYYRWDNSVEPRTEAFPPKFRMIAHSDARGGSSGGETGGNMFTECCDMVGGGEEPEERCTNYNGKLFFPKRKCDFVGFAFGE